VDDSEDDVFFMRRAIENSAITNPVFIADDGLKAVDYLAGKGQFTDRRDFPLPALIFLDLKLPGKKGLDVLAWLREQEHLRSIVVIILTSFPGTFRPAPGVSPRREFLPREAIHYRSPWPTGRCRKSVLVGIQSV
jgi:response regulator RpfG family c-di-GMP phosphodiesterase